MPKPRKRRPQPGLGHPPEIHVREVQHAVTQTHAAIRQAEQALAQGRCDLALTNWGNANMHLGNAQGNAYKLTSPGAPNLLKLDSEIVQLQATLADRCLRRK